MFDRLRARAACRSFDYQWAEIPQGDFLLSDAGFADHVDSILSEEELQIGREWFKGRRVLDAGCGQGRWIEGFLRLGCEVTAIDASAAAVAQNQERYGDRIRAMEADVLRADELFPGEKFDLVFSWGVLHHTRDAAAGVKALSRLVADDGLLYLYLYGPLAGTKKESRRLNIRRLGYNLLPLRARHRLMERRYGPGQAHAMFDLLSTPLNKRYSLDDAKKMLTDAGMTRTTVTIPHTELFLRSDRGSSSADPFFLPQPEPPYWFERLAEQAAARDAETAPA